MRKYLFDIWRLLRSIARRFAQEHCSQAAASLTFATLLALVPMITIALTIFGAFPVFDDFSSEIKSYLLSNMMPEKAGSMITRYVEQFAESATRLKTAGIVILALTAMSMMMTIDKTFNVIWRVQHARPLLKRLLVYAAVLTIAPMLIGASLSLTSWLVGLTMGYAKYIPTFGVGALKVLPTLLTTLAFALLYKLIPNRYVPSRHAYIAALVAALMFEAMNRGFGYYIAHFPTYKLVYGAFASVPIFLMWIYMSWWIILLGAVIAASLSHWRKQDVEGRPPIMDLLLALQALRVLWRNQKRNRVTSFTALSHQLSIGYDLLEHLLHTLKKAELVMRADGRGWALLPHSERTSVTELMRMFALDRYALSEMQGDNLSKWLYQAVTKMETHSAVTLRELFTDCP